jgi:hypothetical protein
MSTAVFPQGMESYNNTETAPFTAQYNSWKGTGRFSYPIGITSGNIRPLTNQDYTNNTPYKHGLARPLKWNYRIGTQTRTNASQESYNTFDRTSRSSAGLALVSQLIDFPGRYSVKHNKKDEINNVLKTEKDCIDCRGVGMVVDYKPSPYLTNNPLPVCTNPLFCCNEPRKALLRVRPASTNLKNNYFTTLQQYRQNRCLTYDQRIFNFQTPLDAATQESIYKNNPYITPASLRLAKPGDPLTELNTYVANCYPNTGNILAVDEIVMTGFYLLKNSGVFTQEDIDTFYQSNVGSSIKAFTEFISNLKSGRSVEAALIFEDFITNPYANNSLLTGPSNSTNCKLVVYKPNNPQFAVQGAVSSSTRILKLGLTTIEKEVYNQSKLNGSALSKLNPGGQHYSPFIYKSKSAPCNPGLPLIFSQITTNPKTCFIKSNDYLNQTFHNLTAAYSGSNVETNGISATNPGGQPLGITR